MRNLRHGLVVCLSVFLLGGASQGFSQEVVKPETVGLSSGQLGLMDGLLNGFVGKKQIAGAVVLLAREGKIAYLKAFGKMDDSRPMRTDTLFRIASNSKPVATVAVLKLAEQGKIALHDPLSMYLPEFAKMNVIEKLPDGSFKMVPARRPILVRHLINFGTGMIYSFYANASPTPDRLYLAKLYNEAGIMDGASDHSDWTNEEYTKRVARMPLLFEPGERMELGIGFELIGHLIKAISGMPLDAFYRRHILDPLKMPDTVFFVPQDELARVSPLWLNDYREVTSRAVEEDRQLFVNDIWPYNAGWHITGAKTFLSAGSGLVSTAYDYFRFMQMLLNRGTLDGVPVLSRKSVELMMTPQHGGRDDISNGQAAEFGFGGFVGKSRGFDIDPGGIAVFWITGLYGTYGRIDSQEKTVLIFFTQSDPPQITNLIWHRLVNIANAALIAE